MSSEVVSTKLGFPKGVMLNAYPDSVGGKLADIVAVLKKPEFRDVFSLFYILPTFFNSDLDRGFSIVDYDLNDELVSRDDLKALDELNVKLKFDLVLNHLSVGSPQFQDMSQFGDESKYRYFFIDWNEFWRSHGQIGADGYVIPQDEYLRKLFMRKPGFPILMVRFPDGTDRPYWNTFYQEINYRDLTFQDLSDIEGISSSQAGEIAALVNNSMKAGTNVNDVDMGTFSCYRDDVISIVERNRDYLGQMDLNAQSEKVWEFYDSTLGKLHEYGAKMVRLDAFAYLHKEPGMTNFFNKPGTWEYLDRLKGLADKYDLVLVPEIHSEYGAGIHEELAEEGYTIYDFFFPGLVIDALDRGINTFLLRWIRELEERNIKTVNMLGCHDGIPVLDLAGKNLGDASRQGLLCDEDIDAVIERIMERGGRVKNLYGPDGKKISYYQVNATFFSAVGEDEQKLLLARAIQLFMPGIPQVWYLDLFAGKNDYPAADKGGTGGHKEINRTNLSIKDIEQGLDREIVKNQLQLMRLRNTLPAFAGELEIGSTDVCRVHLTWRNGACTATLDADLRDCSFSITHENGPGEARSVSYPG